jgi:excisionase family DNA binding protein
MQDNPLHKPPATQQPITRPNSTSGLMTVREFMLLYGVGRTTVYRLVARREITLVKIGTASRIARADAERWASSLPRLGDA